MEGRWVKLYDKLLEWEWFDDEYMVKLMIYFMLKASSRDRQWRGIPIKRGQLISGLKKMSEDLNMSVKVLRNRLEKLEKTGEIVRQAGNQYSIITLTKYDVYQPDTWRRGKPSGTQRAPRGQALDKQGATVLDSINSKDNIECIDISFDDFWDAYDKRTGDKKKAYKKWVSLKDSERKAIMDHLPGYKNSTPHKQYRKDPLTYLNQRGWEHEIIKPRETHGSRSYLKDQSDF